MERVDLEIASLRDSNARIFERANAAEARLAAVQRESAEWEEMNRSLVDQLGRLRAVAGRINSDALAIQFAREAFPGEPSGASALERLCLRQAELIVRELELRARDEGETFAGCTMNARATLGTDHVHSATCDRVKAALLARGVKVRISITGAGEDRSLLAIVDRGD